MIVHLFFTKRIDCPECEFSSLIEHQEVLSNVGQFHFSHMAVLDAAHHIKNLKVILHLLEY